MTEVSGETRSSKPKWYARRWLQLAVALVVGIIIGGSSAGTPGTSDADKKKLADAQSQLAADQITIQAAQDAASRAATDAQAALASQKAKLDARSATLDARAKAVAGFEAAAKANTIPGEGLFLVGKDIQPGTYKSTPADSGNCYYARLSSTDTSDIIDNNNTSGPVVVTIKATDKAFSVSGCNEFHKI